MERPTNTHHPKGGMCRVCRHKLRDCSHLDFRRMPAIERATPGSSAVIVRCTAFERDGGGA